VKWVCLRCLLRDLDLDRIVPHLHLSGNCLMARVGDMPSVSRWKCSNMAYGFQIAIDGIAVI
jgi:hypothetical protein